LILGRWNRRKLHWNTFLRMAFFGQIRIETWERGAG
jgi:hypothetical protein